MTTLLATDHQEAVAAAVLQSIQLARLSEHLERQRLIKQAQLLRALGKWVN
jgi:hypothetical protein